MRTVSTPRQVIVKIKDQALNRLIDEAEDELNRTGACHLNIPNCDVFRHIPTIVALYRDAGWVVSSGDYKVYISLPKDVRESDNKDPD